MAGGASLGSRAIIGMFYERLALTSAPAWVAPLSFRVESNQASEDYKWLGMSPKLREWVEGRRVFGLRADGLTIRNKTFEATMEVAVDELRRDKTGQIEIRIAEMAQRTAQHDASLLSALLIDNPLCYDGQNFFDTDHVSADSGTQSNIVTADISDTGITPGGTATAPSPSMMANAIVAGVARVMGFKDDTGEPLNDGAMEFIAMFPTGLMGPGLAATSLGTLSLGESNLIPNNGGNFRIRPVINPRLTWTDSFALFRSDGVTKPFIVQEEEAVSVSAIAEGSEEEFRNNRHLYGVKRIANVGPGMWQHACKVVFQA